MITYGISASAVPHVTVLYAACHLAVCILLEMSALLDSSVIIEDSFSNNSPQKPVTLIDFRPFISLFL